MRFGALALLALSTLLFTSATAEEPDLFATAPPPDIDAFMQIGYAGNPEITRDGNTLFFTSNASGVNQVYRMDAGGGWPYQLSVFTEGVNFVSLSPTGDYLVCGVARGGDENAQLWLMDARTGQTENLTHQPEARHGSPSWTPDGKALFYSSTEADGKNFYIYKFDLASRTKSLLADIAGWNSAGDVSDDGTKLLVLHAESNTNTDLYLVDLQTGARTPLTEHQGEIVYDSAQFDRTGREVYLLSNGNPDGILRRAVLEVAGRRLQFLDTTGPWEAGVLGLSPDRDVMGWTVNEDGYTRLKLWDLERDRALPVPPLDGQVGGFSFTAGSKVAVSFSSAVNSPDVWIWDWKAPELRKVTRVTYAGVDPSRFVAPELVRYRSFDGTEIPAFLYLPPDYRPGHPVPFVVHVHGGPESQFTPGFIRHFQYLLLNGYGIFAPNVRGSAGYGKAYMDLDNYKKRLDSVKDLKAGADWLIDKRYSAPGLLAVKGGSYGGYMTLAAITEYPDVFSAAVDDVGIANFVTFLRNTADYRRALREAEYGPLSDPEFLESISPLTKADRIKTPLLVIHGENDPRVPVGEARQIAEAVRANGGEVDTLIFADEGHGVAKRANVLTVYRRMVEFLDRTLKPNDEDDGIR
jgi:dipeptidyl aminopeptidase/acylaminoacyl peptidase